MYEKRMQRAREQMARQGVDVLVLTASSDLYYLTGYQGYLSERLTCLMLTADHAYFIMPEFEYDLLSEEMRQRVDCITWTETEDPFAKAAQLFPEGSKLTLAIGAQTPSWILLGFQTRLSSWNWGLGTQVMTPLRACKDPEEQKLLRTAQVLAGKALMKLFEHGIGGMTETAAGELLNQYIKEQGMEIAWLPIVASGPNGSSPHYMTGDRVIQKGDPVVIDFGGSYQGYQADMTRTPVIGKASAEIREVYEIVGRANQAAYEAVRPGIACEEVDRAGRAQIEAAGYGEYFTHRLGHGIGLEEHEEPYIIAGNKTILQPGNSFSDEPGIYLPGRFGVRTEDILIVTETGGDRLTEVSHELFEID